MEGRPVHTSALPREHTRLIEVMHRMNYGRIYQLMVRGGKPIFGADTRIVREIKFGGDNGPRPEAGRDFEIKAAVRDLFAQLEAVGDGVVSCIEVQRGLPFRMTVEEVYA